MTTTITTSTASTATAYSNQRKIDRTSNGVLWSINVANSNYNINAYYSTDDGVTWSSGGSPYLGGGANAYTVNGSFFIDVDDYAHFVYKAIDNGYIYYRRGTPNAARTAWTWSAATLVGSTALYDVPDIVAHREGTGWKAHVVTFFAANPGIVRYWPITIASDQTITVGGAVNVGNSYANNLNQYPSIDFHHTGDGKTVAGSTPHLYVGWSAGAGGAGKGIRFKKATYSGGTWTWGTEREIDPGVFISNYTMSLQCMFDGTRVVIVAPYVYDGSSYSYVCLWDRDEADTTTTVNVKNRINGPGIVDARLIDASSSYDSDGNVYIVSMTPSGNTLQYNKWTRATNTLEASTSIGSVAGINPYVSAKRGYSNNEIEYVYTDGSASPYNVNYGQVALVQNLTSSSSDGAAVSVADSSALLKQFSASDTSSISVSEVSTNFDNLPGNDVFGLTITESASVEVIVIPKSGTDAGSIQTTETANIVRTLTSYDAGSISAVESEFKTIVEMLSSQDAGSIGVAETPSIAEPLSSSDTGSINVAEANSLTQEVAPPTVPPSSTVYEALRDKPVALFQMDGDSPFQDYSGYGRTGSMLAGTQVYSTALCAGCTKSTQFSSANTGQFAAPVFIQGKETDPFSLEAWVFVVSDGTSGEQQILGHNGDMDGLTINGTVISFVTKYLTTGEARITYDLQTNRRAHVVGIHTESKNTLYVDGIWAGEVEISDTQQTDTYVATDGNLYSGATSSTQKINVNVLGLYASPLSTDSVSRHFAAGNKHMQADAVAAAYGGTRIPLSASEGDLAVNRTWATEEDWNTGLLTNISVVDDQLVPWLEAGLGIAGTWQTVVPLDVSGDTSLYGVNMTWDGDGAIVEASVDGGTTWETVSRGVNLTNIPSGTDPTGMVLEIQVSFVGGVDDDPSYLSSLTLNVFAEATVDLIANRTITIPGHVRHDHEPVEMSDDWGVDLAGGALTISADTSTDPMNPLTVEVWLKRTTTNAATWSANLSGASTLYSNGVPGSGYPEGEWVVRHFVASAPITDDITIGGDVQVGQVVLYSDALTPAQVANIYNSYVGLPTVAITDESSINITKSDPSSNIYAYDWAITASG